MSPKDKRVLNEETVQLSTDTLAKHMGQTRKQRACLVFVGGLDVGKVVAVDRDNLVFGRDPLCDIVLQDDGISRKHIRVDRQGKDAIVLTDLGSTNGAFVGGERVSTAVLQQGDKVLVGRRTIFKFEVQDEIDMTYQRQIYESSTLDGLTGVFNRKYFNQRLLAELSFSRRHGLPMSLLMFDLDHFKKVNDTWGHPTGDAVLIGVAGAIKKMIREEDVLARYGGEEFVILTTGIGEEGAAAFAQRVRARIENERIESPDQRGKVLQVTASLGVATLVPEYALRQTVTMAPEIIVSVADRNLYKAKELGRNCVVASLVG